MIESPEPRPRREPAAHRPAVEPVVQQATPLLNARELRRAMLMAEVLGAPRSLRPL
jgi:hypothetical protein